MDTTNDDRAGDLGSVTDEEWRVAHDRLRADLEASGMSGPELDQQFAYVWSPGKPAREGGNVRDIAPADGQWDGRLRDGVDY